METEAAWGSMTEMYVQHGVGGVLSHRPSKNEQKKKVDRITPVILKLWSHDPFLLLKITKGLKKQLFMWVISICIYHIRN